MEKQPVDKKGRIAQIATFVVVFCIAFFGTQYFFKKDIGVELQKVSTELNAKCPMQVDSETRLDGTQFSKPKTIQYNYTILRLDAQNPTIDLTPIEKAMRENAQKNLDSSDQMKLFRENDVTMKYNYKDKNGNLLFEFTINPTKK